MTGLNKLVPLAGMALLLCASVCRGVVYVSPDGAHVPPFADWGNAATSVAAAVSISTAGDTVLIAPGHYRLAGSIRLTAAVEVCGSGEAADIVLDAGGSDRCFVLDHPDARLDSLTLTGGRAAGGGGVWVEQGTISGCLVISNTATADACPGQDGGGIYLNGAGTVSNCILYANAAGDDGGGMYLNGGGQVVNSVLHHNRAFAGGGLYLGAGGTVDHCTLAENTAVNGGGAHTFEGGALRNCLLHENGADNRPDVEHSGAGAVFSCCLAALPLPGVGQVAGPAVLNRSYRLCAGSAGIDAADGEGAPLDFDGEERWDDPSRPNNPSPADIGFDEFVDSDRDALADSWERRHFDGLTAASGEQDADGDGLDHAGEYYYGSDPGAADTDGDGMNDGDEVTAGTDLLDQSDCLKARLLRPPSSAWVVQWPTVTGRVYTLRRCADLPTAAWSNVAGMVDCPGDGSFLQYELDLADTAAVYFAVQVTDP